MCNGDFLWQPIIELNAKINKFYKFTSSLGINESAQAAGCMDGQKVVHRRSGGNPKNFAVKHFSDEKKRKRQFLRNGKFNEIVQLQKFGAVTSSDIFLVAFMTFDISYPERGEKALSLTRSFR